MSKLDKLRKKNGEDDEIWSSVSDLMSGLMIVFLFVSVSFMLKADENQMYAISINDKVADIVNTYQENKREIYNDLEKEFKSDKEKWSMEIDIDGTIRFNEPDIFFLDNSDEINKKFKIILDDFFPRYIKTVYDKHKNSVKEVRIEGHTSSKWSEKSSKSTAYFENMKLSQDRTRSVLKYVMKLEDMKKYNNWMMKNVTANGMSSSKLKLYENGNENEEESRRVEFRIITNAEDALSDILEELEGKK